MLDDLGYRGARIAVLGASGFVGRWVARAACARGARAYLVVRNRETAESIFSIYDIHGEIWELDLLDGEAVDKFFRTAKPSITFNLAGYGVDRSERDEATAYAINAHLVERLCAAIARTLDPILPVKKIVHIGSGFEYGEIGGNLSEDSNPNPTTLYAKSKLAGTRLLKDACGTYRLDGLTARLFTVYGPGEHQGRLLPSLLESARTNEVLQLTEGLQKRDFTYVEDVAEGLLHLGQATTPPGEIVNLASGKLTPVRSFVETAVKLLGVPRDKLQFGQIPTRTEEMQHSEVTVEKLHRLTTWLPSTTIAEGIGKTRDFFDSGTGKIW